MWSFCHTLCDAMMIIYMGIIIINMMIDYMFMFICLLFMLSVVCCSPVFDKDTDSLLAVIVVISSAPFCHATRHSTLLAKSRASPFTARNHDHISKTSCYTEILSFLPIFCIILIFFLFFFSLYFSTKALCENLTSEDHRHLDFVEKQVIFLIKHFFSLIRGI